MRRREKTRGKRSDEMKKREEEKIEMMRGGRRGEERRD